MWSIGCILAEIILGKDLFPRRNHIYHFILITELLGKLSKEVIKRVYTIYLVEKMLNVDLYRIITTADAIKHLYIVTYQDSNNEPIYLKFLADEWKSIVAYDWQNDDLPPNGDFEDLLVTEEWDILRSFYRYL
ncbi:hypothetical protein N7489_003629 [Penicillium chrysogenum]|uniref:uncharacterized protein n=1 Tax=Penicillium chrysogenum TaxID=5076 RepID=UPI0024DF197F|nr:uncharacterized protein N7489_003629 [Penicillium chrysogenum]KAJ5253219.1 hypothetical protein N7489_003629 [Penicillium chrysogenum]